jgi:RNA polymerase sigma-54 factor
VTYSTSLNVNLRVTQKQILTPGLVQMVSVLALNKLELRDMINQEMVENPILEELAEQDLEAPPSVEEIAAAEERRAEVGDREGLQPDGKDPFEEIDFGSFFDDYLDPGYRSPAAEVIEKPSFENFLSSPTTLADHLQWQLSLSAAPAPIEAAAQSIIGNLNEDGFLTATPEEIAQSDGHKPKEVEQALKLVQEFDPPGVAARDLRECLLIQLRGIGMDRSTAGRLVAEHLHLLQNKQYKELARLLNKPPSDIDLAVEVIRRLDPRPGQRYNKVEPRLIEPDVFFVKVGEYQCPVCNGTHLYQVLHNEDDLPQLRLNPSYRRLLDRTVAGKDVRNYVKERYNSAVQLIKNIEQRKQTIHKVCHAIIGRQQDFLDYGLDHLKPMMIKEVAEEVGVHPSTVSRAVANKYSHTPQGVYELRFFFSEAVNGPMGGGTSLLTLKRKVKKMIGEEDPARPLTDDQITRILQSQGIQVTRRTVAKYREDMRIPSTHQRRVKK